jgi:hypothetical protein
MIVGFSTDVLVALGDNGRWFFKLNLVELGIEDVLDAFVGVNASRQSTAARSFQTILPVGRRRPRQER